MSYPIIETPRGKIIVNNATMKAELTWNPKFKDKKQKSFTTAQKYVDSEVLRLCEPYVPLLTGMLIMSGILGTEVGSGTVSWIAPYSRKQYYNKRKPGSQTGKLRGGFWFQRMKEIYAADLIANARKIAKDTL